MEISVEAFKSSMTSIFMCPTALGVLRFFTEEAVAYVMGLLIKEGKIRGLGQSSPTVEHICKAHAVTPITAIQSEYSMMERKWEKTSFRFAVN